MTSPLKVKLSVQKNFCPLFVVKI